MRPVRTLLIDNYDSYTYNLFQQIAVVNGGAIHTGAYIYVFTFIVHR